MPRAELYSILEAAGRAASAFNHQPWRFLISQNGDARWEEFVSLLIPLNQQWAANASVLIFLLSDSFIDMGSGPVLSRTHSFDAGAAWAHLALQATRLGYHCHAMAGVDFERARNELSVPDQFHIEVAIAIGRRAPAEFLPEPLQEREIRSGRRPLDQMAFFGHYPVPRNAA
jgi:nitroreductase